MRKLGLVLISSLALLAALGAGAPVASADPLADCDGGQPKGINGFHIVTIPDTANAIADVYGGGAICGMEGTPNGEHGKKFYILTAGGMDPGEGGAKVRCMNPRYAGNGHNAYCEGTDLGAPYNPQSKIGPFVGTTHTDLQRCGAIICNKMDSIAWNNVNAVEGLFGIGIVENPKCNSLTVVQCISGTDDQGTGVTHITVEPCWVVSWCQNAKAPGIPELDPQHNRYVMTIYDITNEPPLVGNAWYLEIGEVYYAGHESGEPDPEDYHLCGIANLNPNARTCGTDNTNWIHKNGPAGRYGPAAPNQYKCTSKPEGYAIEGLTTKNNKYDGCNTITWQ